MQGSIPIPGGPQLRWSRVSRTPLTSDDVTEVRTGIGVDGRDYHCRGTIAEFGAPAARRFEFVLHGPGAPADERAVLATFLDFDQAVQAAPRLAKRWVASYADPVGR